MPLLFEVYEAIYNSVTSKTHLNSLRPIASNINYLDVFYATSDIKPSKERGFKACPLASECSVTSVIDSCKSIWYLTIFPDIFEEALICYGKYLFLVYLYLLSSIIFWTSLQCGVYKCCRRHKYH